MLTPIGELTEGNRSLCETYGWIALDLTNGSYMSKNEEKDHIYILSVRNAMAIVIWADSDQEAIDKANYQNLK